MAMSRKKVRKQLAKIHGIVAGIATRLESLKETVDGIYDDADGCADDIAVLSGDCLKEKPKDKKEGWR